MKIPGVRRNAYIAFVLFLIFLVCSGLGVAAASSGGSHGESEAKGWVTTDTWRVMNFTVLVIGLFILLRKPVSQALQSRIKGIRDQLDDLESKKKAAEKKLAEYDERLSLLDQEAEKIVAEYVRQGNEAKARILKEAESAAGRLEEQAQRNIEHEFNRAKLKLQEEILEKALIKAEEVIKDRITPVDQEKLVNEYLEKVVAS